MSKTETHDHFHKVETTGAALCRLAECLAASGDALAAEALAEYAVSYKNKKSVSTTYRVVRSHRATLFVGTFCVDVYIKERESDRKRRRPALRVSFEILCVQSHVQELPHTERQELVSVSDDVTAATREGCAHACAATAATAAAKGPERAPLANAVVQAKAKADAAFRSARHCEAIEHYTEAVRLGCAAVRQGEAAPTPRELAALFSNRAAAQAGPRHLFFWARETPIQILIYA